MQSNKPRVETSYHFKIWELLGREVCMAFRRMVVEIGGMEYVVERRASDCAWDTQRHLLFELVRRETDA